MNHYLTPAEYLPHDAPMLLLEEVVAVTDAAAHCRSTVNRGGVLAPFLTAQGDLPGWYALELMAQTVGVWSGWHRRRDGQRRPMLGMVLGARGLNCPAGQLPGGACLEVAVSLLMQDTRFASFDCVIRIGAETMATGRINTFQPTTEEIASLFNQGDSL